MSQDNSILGKPQGSQVQGQGSEGSSQRNVSYGELAELENLFEEQIKERGIEFTNDEQMEEARFDFIQQFIDGNDNPVIHIINY